MLHAPGTAYKASSPSLCSALRGRPFVIYGMYIKHYGHAFLYEHESDLIYSFLITKNEIKKSIISLKL